MVNQVFEELIINTEELEAIVGGVDVLQKNKTRKEGMIN